MVSKTMGVDEIIRIVHLVEEEAQKYPLGILFF
jgi:hypothetical protein